MSKFRQLVENLNDIKQRLSQSSIKEGDKKVFDKKSQALIKLHNICDFYFTRACN